MVWHPVFKRSMLVQFKCLTQKIESLKKRSWKEIQTWMFRQGTKCTYTFPMLWAEGEMKEEAGIHGQSLAVPFSEENVPWDPQRGSKHLHAGTQLDRKCMSGPACAPLAPLVQASMGTADLLRLRRTTESARESACGFHAAGWGCHGARD